MEYLVILLFVMALLDQHLTNLIESNGHLSKLLLRVRWRKQRLVLRLGGAVLAFFVLFFIGRRTGDLQSKSLWM